MKNVKTHESYLKFYGISNEVQDCELEVVQNVISPFYKNADHKIDP